MLVLDPGRVARMSSGVSLPSGVSMTLTLNPPTRSGAAASSTWMWALLVVSTEDQRGVQACSARTLAPVPLKTGKTPTPVPKTSPSTSVSRAV